MNEEDYISYCDARKDYEIRISRHLGKMVGGCMFDILFPSSLIKLIKETENHNGMQFVAGENKDNAYFTHFWDLPYWLNYGGREIKYFRYVILSPDSQVHIENIHKIKADKIILSDIREISDHPLWSDVNFAMMAMIITDCSLKYIEKHSKDSKFQANFIAKFGMNGIRKLLKLNVSISEELLIEVVRKDPSKLHILIEYNKTINASVSEEVQLLAVERDCNAIEVLLKNILVSERVLLTTLKHHDRIIHILLDHGINVTEEMQLLAVERDCNAIEVLLKNILVSERVLLTALKHHDRTIQILLDYGINITEEMQLLAVERDCNAIKALLRNISVSERVILTALKHHGWTICFLLDYGINVTEEMQLLAVEGDCDAIKALLKNISVSESVILTALKHHNQTIHILMDYRINVTEEMQLLAVERDCYAIKSLLRNISVSESVILTALKHHNQTIQILLDYGINITEEMQLLAVERDCNAIKALLRNISVSERVLLTALKHHDRTIHILLDRGIKVTEEMQKAAVRKHKKALKYMLEYDNNTQLSEEVLLEAARHDGYSIKYLLKKGLSVPEEVQLTAVRQNADVLNLLLRYDAQVSDEVYIAFAEKRG